MADNGEFRAGHNQHLGWARRALRHSASQDGFYGQVSLAILDLLDQLAVP